MRFQLYEKLHNVNRLQPSAEDQRFVVGKGRGVALVAQQLHEQSPNLASQIRHCRGYLHPGKRFARKRKWSRIGVVQIGRASCREGGKTVMAGGGWRRTTES